MSDHDECPEGGEHDFIKPSPHPHDHKYECSKCGHYDLDDYE